jgi:hypothetical protein
MRVDWILEGGTRPSAAGAGLVGRRGRRRARHKVVESDSEAAMRGDAALRQVCGHSVSSSRCQIAGGPSGGVVIAGHGEARQRNMVGVCGALGALVLRVADQGALQWSHGCVEAMVKGEERPMMDLAVGMQSPELRGMRGARLVWASGVRMGGADGKTAGGGGGIQSGGGAYSPEK